MRAVLAIAGRELRATFSSPFGCALVAGYLALAGVLLVAALRGGEARLDGWFAPLFVLTAVLGTLLTMRAFAEEERTGSLELLLAAPVRASHVVGGKLLGAAAVLVVIAVATASAPWLLWSYAEPDAGPIASGYVGFLLVGVAACSVGLATSSATQNQLVAAASSTGLVLGLWFGAGVADAFGGTTGAVLTYLSPATHVGGFLRGTISLVDVTYFASAVVLATCATVTTLRARR